MMNRKTPKTEPARPASTPIDIIEKNRPLVIHNGLNPISYQKAVRRKRRRKLIRGCLFTLLIPGSVLLLIAIYLLAPFRTNLLILGLDARPEEGNLGRSDTIVLMTFLPFEGHTGALSIPRDLWVNVPGHGENRINTAHFFGEIDHPGSGPQAALDCIQVNFDVNVKYYVRIRFDGFQEVVDAMDGIDVDLPSAMSGYTAGSHHLDGEQALALVRDRKGSDDFFRMERAQIFIKAVWKQFLQPTFWPKIPAVLRAMSDATDTNLPVWLWPRLTFTLLRSGADGIDSRTISREMVTPFTTSGGAQVLGPNWDAIMPVIREMFGY